MKLNNRGWGLSFLIVIGAIFLLILIFISLRIRSMTHQIKDDKIDEDTLMEAALEAGASDFNAEEEFYEISTEYNDLAAVREVLEGQGYAIESAEHDKVPTSYITLESEDDIKMMNLLLEHLEDNDDVQEVYHNWEEA